MGKLPALYGESGKQVSKKAKRISYLLLVIENWLKISVMFIVATGLGFINPEAYARKHFSMHLLVAWMSICLGGSFVVSLVASLFRRNGPAE